MDAAKGAPARTLNRGNLLAMAGKAAGLAGLMMAGGSGHALAASRAFGAPASIIRKSGGSITVGVIGDILNFDAFNYDQVNYPYTDNVYDELMHLDNKGVAHPAIVVARTFSDGGRTMTLKLRKGVTYHAGGVVTAADVAANLQRARSPQTGGNMYANMSTVQSVAAVGNDTVVVRFSAPTPYTDDMLGLMPVIDPRHYSTLKSKEAGTGPFKVAEWVPNDHLTLVKNKDYWDAGKPYLDRVTFKIYGDDTSMLSALQGGLLDIAVAVPPRAYAQFKSQFTIRKGQEAAEFYYLGLNAKVEPFNKREVRQAMAYAMDRATMVKSVLYGLSPVLYTPFPPFSPAYFPEYNHRFDYNLAKARQLLAKAGYPKGIEFTVPTPNNFPEMALFAQIMQADLAKIGSKMKIQPMDPASWYPILLKGTFKATFSFAGGAQIYPTRITLSNNFAPSANPVWPGGLPPAAYRQAVHKADTTLDPAQQKAAFKAMVDSFVTEAWNIPIGYRVTLFALKPNVRGFGYGVYNEPRLANVSLA
jgi:peptide/nickel transport system substrate-binding protein